MWGFSGGVRRAFMDDPVVGQAVEQAVEQAAQQAQQQMFDTRAALNRVAQQLLENPVGPQQAPQQAAQVADGVQQQMPVMGPASPDMWTLDAHRWPLVPRSDYTLPPKSSAGYEEAKWLADLAASDPEKRYTIDVLRSFGKSDAQIARDMRDFEANRMLAETTPSASFETWARRFPDIPLHEIAKATLDPKQDFFNVGPYPPNPRDFQTLVPTARRYQYGRRGRTGEFLFYQYAPDADAYARALSAYMGTSIPGRQDDQTGLMIRAAAGLMGGQGVPPSLRKGAMSYLGGLFGVDADDSSGMRASDLVGLMSPEAQALAFGSNPQAGPDGLPALRSPVDFERQLTEAVRGGTMTDRVAAELQSYLQRLAQEQFQARENTRTLEQIRQQIAGQEPRFFGLISGERNNPLLGALMGDNPVTARQLADLIAAQEQERMRRRQAANRPAAPIQGIRTPFSYGQ